MNNVTLIGRLTSEPDLRATQSGQSVASFTLAVDKSLSKQKKQEMEANGQPTADFILCQAWGKTAELIEQYSAKGKRLGVVGRIQTRNYKDAAGVVKYITEVVAEKIDIIDFVDNQFDTTGQGFGQPMGEPQDDFGFGGDFEPRNDDNIPF